MYAFISKLLISGKLKFKKGEIDLLGRPICIVPISFFKEVALKSNNDKEFMRNIYLEAWESGLNFCYAVDKTYKLNTFEDRYKIAMDVLAMAGFGDYTTHEFQRGKFTKYKVVGNPLTKILYPSKSPVDHLLRGFNAGGGTVVHSKILNCIELECAAVNGKFCEFLSGTSKVLNNLDKQIITEQLGDLDSLLKAENKIIKEHKYVDIKT